MTVINCYFRECLCPSLGDSYNSSLALAQTRQILVVFQTEMYRIFADYFFFAVADTKTLLFTSAVISGFWPLSIPVGVLTQSNNCGVSGPKRLDTRPQRRASYIKKNNGVEKFELDWCAIYRDRDTTDFSWPPRVNTNIVDNVLLM